MGKSAFRKMVSCVLMCLFPASMFASDTSAAMLYTNGAAWVNGARVPRASSAIFPGDLLQTNHDSVANINESGLTVTVLSGAKVEFDGPTVDVRNGGVAISTSKGVGATAGDLTVTPKSNAWTEFNILHADKNGTVLISAKKGDLNIEDGNGDVVTLAQGQEATKDDTTPDNGKDTGKKKKRKQQAGAAPAAGGGILNSPVAIAVGAGAVAGVTIWVLTRPSNPASPSTP